MSGQSTIEWTDATWNPVTGCSHVSPGCDHCYAETLTRRFADAWGVPDLPWTPENAAENVVLHPDRLSIPERWRKPRMVFVNSMSDLFHPRVPGEFIRQVWLQMFNNPRHTYQILTKRPKRLRDWTRATARANGWPEDKVWPDWMWVGTSIESRDYVDRADMLRETPAAVRFISAEPLLGPLVEDGITDDLAVYWTDGYDGPGLSLQGIHWLIVGGESGPGHRPIDPNWVRRLCFDAALTDTPFFFKQWGGQTPKAGGRELDGRTYDQMPMREAVAA